MTAHGALWKWRAGENEGKPVSAGAKIPIMPVEKVATP
jgi:hypothetical protein